MTTQAAPSSTIINRFMQQALIVDNYFKLRQARSAATPKGQAAGARRPHEGRESTGPADQALKVLAAFGVNIL